MMEQNLHFRKTVTLKTKTAVFTKKRRPLWENTHILQEHDHILKKNSHILLINKQFGVIRIFRNHNSDLILLIPLIFGLSISIKKWLSNTVLKTPPLYMSMAILFIFSNFSTPKQGMDTQNVCPLLGWISLIFLEVWIVIYIQHFYILNA